MKKTMAFMALLALFLSPISVGLAKRVSATNPLVAPAVSQVRASATLASVATTFNYTVTLNTTMGVIVIGLFDDMPITSGNFKNLTTLELFDGTIFHRVVKNFVIQGGDIFAGKGINITKIPDELPNKHSNIRGSVAMAKSSYPNGTIILNSATSQFYVNVADNAFLDSVEGNGYSVFGQVTEGMNVVDNISNVTTDVYDRPIISVTVTKATLSQDVPEYSLVALAALFVAATLLVAVVQRVRKTGLILRRKKQVV
jgi:cyclophilin family peptidyl-prolyl cis-trans isomerase